MNIEEARARSTGGRPGTRQMRGKSKSKRIKI
jgi:hypothetical protein